MTFSCQSRDYLKKTKRHLVISGITEEVWATFERVGVIKKFGRDNLFLTDEMNPQLSTWRGCMRAQDMTR
jgi:hypothetical protein